MAVWTTPRTWVTGEIPTAAIFNLHVRDNETFLYPTVSDSQLVADTANFDISSITSVYRHLEVFLYARCDLAGVADDLWIRFNNDSGNTYDSQRQLGSAAVNTSAETFGVSRIVLDNAIPGNTAGSNLFSSVHLIIENYADASNNKVAMCRWTNKTGTATGNMNVGHAGGFWRSNNAINRITLLTATGGVKFKAGSRCTIYGRQTA